MFVTINGQLGSGKSEVCKILENENGFEVFSTGKIQRAFALELGISTLELNELCSKDHSYDDIIDGRLVEHAKNNVGKDIIFDSRMAWHFVPDAYRVHLLVSPIVAAERVFFKRMSKVETYTSVEDAMEELVERHRLETERYKVLYNVNVGDYTNYDIVIDTSELTPREVTDLILDGMKTAGKGIYVSPKNIYPTITAAEATKEFQADYLQKLGTDKEYLSVAQEGTELFVTSKHGKLLTYLLANRPLIPVKLDGKAVNTLSAQELHDWERAGDFKYFCLPRQQRK